jgi:uncharacterized cupredoxin-like copper-binding protein
MKSNFRPTTQGVNLLRGIRLLIGAVMFMLGLGACAQAPTAVPVSEDEVATVGITLTEFGIEMDSEVIPSGAVRFLITNAGLIEHNFYLEPVDAIQEPLLTEAGLPAAIEGIQSGETVILDYQFDTPGQTYQLGCHLPGHFEAGMVRLITIGE